jgi:Zn-finger nucleic acid-binding protein
MESMDFRGVSLDECIQCGGIWFDDGELKKLQTLGDQLSLHSAESQAVAQTKSRAPDRQPKLCPVCHEALTPFEYMYSSNIILDECDNCYGIWVQDGELQKMAEYMEQDQSAIDSAKREVIAAIAAETQMASRSKKNRGKGIVAFWSIFGTSRPGRPI